MSTVATLLAKLELDTSGFMNGIKSIPNSLGSIGSGMTQVGGAITRGVTLPVVAAGAAVLYMGNQALQVGADFEKSMSGVGAILGSTKDETKLLSDEALRLGLDPNLVVSASEAAGVMEELAKNGITAQQILGGAAEGTIALANATGVDFNTAAQIAGTSMALFNIQAEDMEQVVNQVTAVANESRFTVEDFAQAIGMGGAAAQSAGVPFDEFTASIAALSTVTASGSDAGTSFKTFLTRLTPSSDKAREAMTKLGLITEENGNRFYDASGNMKSMAEVAGILDQTLSGMSELERTNALEVMFGSDASRAAIGFMQTGEQGFKDLMATMAQTNAAENAATRMDNLAGATEILGGVIEAFQIKFTQALGPGARTAVEAFTNFLTNNSGQVEGLFQNLSVVFTDMGNSLGPWLEQNGPKMFDFFNKMITALPGFIAKLVEIGTVAAPMVEKLFNAFMEMDPATIVNIMSAIGGLAALGPVLVGVGGFITTIASIVPVLTSVWTGIATIGTTFASVSVTVGTFIASGILLPLLVIIGTIALVYMAWKTNFGGIQTTINQLGFLIKHFATQALQGWMFLFTTMYNTSKKNFDLVVSAVNKVKSVFDSVMLGISNAIQTVINKIIELAKKLLSLALPKALTPGSPTPFEIGLLGIADAMKEVNSVGLPSLNSRNNSNLPNLNSSQSNGSSVNPAGNKNMQIIINNPKKETSEESIKKQLNSLSYLGVID